MQPDMLIHPGEILAQEFLKPYRVTVDQLATGLDVPIDTLSAIVEGTRAVDGPMSKLLGHAFNMSEEFFANLQVRYELDRATMEAQQDNRAADRLRRADKFASELRAHHG